MNKKKKRTWKIVGFSVLGILIVLAAGAGFAYQQLQPENHFKTIPVVSSGKGNNNASTNQTEQVKDPIFNILLMGSDMRKGDAAGHSDSMLLVHVDLSKNKFQAVSIPRDTRVHVDGYGYTKLTSVQYIMQSTQGSQKGVEAAVNSVSELTGVPINYYVETNYWGLQSMVDAVGGIDMNIPFNVTLTHPWYPEDANKVVTAGTHSFDGKMVTEIVHERYSLQNEDYGRQQLQEEALKGIAKKSLNPSNVTKLPALIKSVSDYIIASNMSTSDMVSLGLAAKNFDPNTQLQYQQLHGVGQSMYDDILKANNDQIVINPQEIKDVISKNFS